jgi:predicted ATP-grasp superfamily ATP-dependent carboligase
MGATNPGGDSGTICSGLKNVLTIRNKIQIQHIIKKNLKETASNTVKQLRCLNGYV